ncbi:MAG: DUF1361 domain-containing protein [Cyanobacteria bacterium RM1_2_2]|nr:DUF1361 domain-containing protein [Cyanobacteria bacterium RM1_2_2]
MSAKLYEVLLGFSNVYSGWILWNLFLAFIPLVLSFWLFRRKKISRSLVWWGLLIVFITFLPNAPYMLTDIIHLIRGTRDGLSIWVIALAIIPVHLAAMLGGFEAYVVSLINQGYYLKKQGVNRVVVWASEILTHAICAVGIYLGRFNRFNSWDFINEPGDIIRTTVRNLISKQPAVITLVTFVILIVLYWIMKQITLGLYLRYRYLRLGKDVLE